MRPSTRAFFVVVALPLLLLLERLAWYGTRSVQFLHLDQLGWTPTDIGQLVSIQTVVLAVVTVLSGVLALGVGPLPLISLGLLLAGAGYAMVPMFDPGSVEVPLYLVVVGTALFRPAVWAAVLIPLCRPRETGRIGACILLYGASNAAALAASPGAAWLRSHFGSETVYTGASAVVGLAFLGSLALAAGWLATRGEEAKAAPGPSRTFDVPLLLAAAALGVLLFIPWAGLMSGFQAIYTVLWDLPFVAGNETIWTSLNPAIVIFLALLFSSILLVLVLFEKTVPALLLVGAGLFLIATGLIALAIEPVRMTAWGFGLGLALVSVGEITAAPALLSRIGGDVHWRLTTLFVALWLSTSSLGYWATGALGAVGIQSQFGVPLAFAIITVPIALVLLVVAIPLQRRLFAPPPSAGEPGPGAVVPQPQL